MLDRDTYKPFALHNRIISLFLNHKMEENKLAVVKALEKYRQQVIDEDYDRQIYVKRIDPSIARRDRKVAKFVDKDIGSVRESMITSSICISNPPLMTFLMMLVLCSRKMHVLNE